MARLPFLPLCNSPLFFFFFVLLLLLFSYYSFCIVICHYVLGEFFRRLCNTLYESYNFIVIIIVIAVTGRSRNCFWRAPIRGHIVFLWENSSNPETKWPTALNATNWSGTFEWSSHGLHKFSYRRSRHSGPDSTLTHTDLTPITHDVVKRREEYRFLFLHVKIFILSLGCQIKTKKK